MNSETGEAETPAHPYSTRWRSDLDRQIEEYEKRQDRERARAELSVADRKVFDRVFQISSRAAGRSFEALPSGGSFEAAPSARPGSLMQKLMDGPVSKAEARYGGGR